MFYANNEQVKGIFLNGRNYNYLAYSFGKIIPEDRNAEQLNLNLAYKYLNQYRIEFGTVKDGYENALVSPRFDKPDSNGVFNTPFTYYHNGNIISTKEVNVRVNNAHWALLNASVYNDININGNITYFATNTDFQGHSVNVFPEGEDEPIYKARLNQPILSNCTNFSFDIQTRFSKQDGYPSVDSCNNFSGNFKYVGNQDSEYPGFIGFLEECKDGVFNIDCTNMHGGGSAANVTNYYNFSCISSSHNIKLNINGSPWQAWVHPHCYSSNCNINTRYIVPGFDRMRDCNFNLYIPGHADVEKSALYSILSNSSNCNVYFDGIHSNIYSFRNGSYSSFLFEDLNDCNLNLMLNGSTGLDYFLGSRLNNCNIYCDSMTFGRRLGHCWGNMSNCNITANVINADSIDMDLVAYSTNVNLNVDASSTSNFSLLWNSSNINGNAILGNFARVMHSNNLILNLYNGNIFEANNVEHGRFNLNRTNVHCTNLNNIYARAYNTSFRLDNTNNTNIYSDGGNTSILGADNCYNLKLSGLTFQTPDSDSLFENVYNSDLKFGIANPYYRLWRVESCTIDGFPRALTYVNNCVFRPFDIRQVGLTNSEVGTWNNVWPHRTTAGIRTSDIISNCRIYARQWNTDGSITFESTNNMQTSFGNYYDGVVTANLPIYNMNIKLNVDCNTLNLGIFQAGPPHGFQNATISANNIYAKGNKPSAYVQLNCDTKLYCENYCNVCLSPYVSNINSVLQPVILINNYDHYNSGNQGLVGGLTRIGSLSTRTGSRSLFLNRGACVFINNAVLGYTIVDNSLLFLGSNVTWTNGANVTNGGRIRNAANLTSDDIRFIDRGQLCWNLWDYGPWGSYRLIDFCTSV